jgi:hypothetical protein
MKRLHSVARQVDQLQSYYALEGVQHRTIAICSEGRGGSRWEGAQQVLKPAHTYHLQHAQRFVGLVEGLREAVDVVQELVVRCADLLELLLHERQQSKREVAIRRSASCEGHTQGVHARLERELMKLRGVVRCVSVGRQQHCTLGGLDAESEWLQ